MGIPIPRLSFLAKPTAEECPSWLLSGPPLGPYSSYEQTGMIMVSGRQGSTRIPFCVRILLV